MTDELRQMSRNLWWTWNPEAQEIFADLSPLTWTASHHNAVAVLNSLSSTELTARLMERAFSARVSGVLLEFNDYLTRERTWCSTHAAPFLKSPVAYFSAEFAIHESLPIYSGGLGVLAGDHLKSASDLGVPLVSVSLFYRQGYFQQTIAPHGWQEEHYPLLDCQDLAVDLVLGEDGNPLILSVELQHAQVKFQAWRLRVGFAVLYLLDSDLMENDDYYRDLTSRVYGGDTAMRIGQEIVMGIGGVRLLRALNITPAVFHMNEGHSAFLTFELLREQLTKGSSLKAAEGWVRDHCVFTTHTPVPAGHDRFSPEHMEYVLGKYRAELSLDVQQFLSYGRVNPDDDQETFCMTVLALKLSRAANGVSELHGEVSREMWRALHMQKTTPVAPIGHITNGIHVRGWMTRPTRRFWKAHLGADWETRLMYPDLWKIISDRDLVSDEEIWALRYWLRRELVEFARKKLRGQFALIGEGAKVFDKILSPDALTIGFARRFATYKRAPLIFSDFARAIALFNDPKQPVQLVFAGKAHPRDDRGKEFIQRIHEITRRNEFFGKVIFLENYDIRVARYLISGADVWLNTPRRGLEASGTSGQKVGVHGGLNLSVLDGWWREGFDGTNGWSIGGDQSLEDPEAQDAADAESLYETLTQSVMPLFFDRNEQGIPCGWIEKIRRAMQTLIPQYNTDRMVAEYVTKYYLSKKLVLRG
ncbi:MAG: alpha-glucan family phosphorylase [Acidobacteria bacterium]|nr:alpha-glucan family phosphorylase [Acidobacteriota bacterium]